MYVKVEELGLALKMFDESPERNMCESILLWNVLINGCCKVGDLGKAVEFFEGIPERNSGWNSLINGFIGNGIGRERVSFSSKFQRRMWMLDERVRANDLAIVFTLSASAKIFFLVIVTACSHFGQVDMGFTVLDSMTLDYSHNETLHITCRHVRHGRLA
ncbi:hypothetical protein QYF36_014109 [Acer negundo]|nr:hypothetical protein QYF36_014109 [Acer negundo]